MESQELKKQISRVVDMWVTEIMRAKFLDKPGNMERRSLWDKFKQGMTNWAWGRNGEKNNPYRWRNRFGDELGVAESFNPTVFTLNEYMGIKGVVETVENRLVESDGDFDKLRLMQLVRSAAETLKDMLFNSLNGKVSAVAPPSGGSDPRREEPAAVGGTDVSSQAADRPKTGVVDDPRNSQQAARVEPKADIPTARVEPKVTRLVTQPVTDKRAKSDNAASGNKTDRQKIENAAAEATQLMTSETTKLTPNKEWIRGGKLLKEKIPHVLVWMSMKGHRESLKDDHIRQELKDILGMDVDLGMPASSGKNIERYLRRILAERFETVMRSLGVDFKESAGKKAPNEQESAGEEVPSEPESTGEEVSSEPESTGEEVSSLFKDYFYDGDRALEPKEVFARLHGLVQRLVGGIESAKANKLKEWYSEEGERLRRFKRDDRAEHLQANMINTDNYLKKIMEITGLTKKQIRKNSQV